MTVAAANAAEKASTDKLPDVPPPVPKVEEKKEPPKKGGKDS